MSSCFCKNKLLLQSYNEVDDHVNQILLEDTHDKCVKKIKPKPPCPFPLLVILTFIIINQTPADTISSCYSAVTRLSGV